MTTLLQGFTTEQRDRFEDRGLVRLEGLVPRRAAEQMAESLWQELARRHRIHRRDRATWRVERPADFKRLSASGAFTAMATPAMRALLDDLLGREPWVEPPRWGQPLVCFPTQHRWDVPHKSWHLDLPADPRRHRMLVGRLFLVVAPLGPKGGGTLVATGSHRIVRALADQADVQLSSSAMRKHLQSENRWFADLMSVTRDLDRTDHFMARATTVNGVPLQVEEMVGEPGDVWLMHPAALHAAAPNNRDEPRLVVSQFVMPKGYFA